VPSNARWRRFKIVDSPEQPKGQELIAGLKNALERGESIEKAKKSFVNAGYKQEDVEAASLGMSQVQPIQTPAEEEVPTEPEPQQPSTQETTQPQPQPQQTQPQTPPSPEPQPTPVITTTQQPKKKFPLFITILIIIAIIDLFGAAFFIFFWDKIF